MFELKLNKQMAIFSFSSPINVSEEGKWLLAVTSFEVTNSVFKITDKNNSFLFLTPNFWTPEGGEELINELNSLLELRSQIDIDLHVKEVEKSVLEQK